ncbi:cytosolic protein [Bacillus sp. V2I10]|uniref:cytosolic protein n=1 Tax=Bacillus sp. V2I10 TaxID=3042276 RepID=UPI002789A0E9|nr:cytosolic protein [Bacillus sp. V2I10]MDQ0857556.1 hypothetical protein [Bacillus sp. V2I10]
MDDKEKREYTDFSNVEDMRNMVLAEIFPEGPYGAPRGKDEPVENKSSEWKEGQRYYSAYNYEFKSLHQNLPRQYPGAHPTHDDPGKNEEPPYTSK